MDIFDKLAQKPTSSAKSGDIFDTIKEGERGLWESAKRGYASGTMGIMQGSKKPAPTPEDETTPEYLAATAGKFISDIPSMGAGMLAGGAAGSAVPIIGSAIGGGVGAFALPALIDESLQEYRNHVSEGNDITFGEFLDRAGRVTKETGKSAVVGAATAGVSKLLPILKNIPGADKLLKTRLGRTAAQIGLPYAAMTGAQAAVEQKVPEGRELLANALMIGGLHAMEPRVRSLGKDISNRLFPSEEPESFSSSKERRESISAKKIALKKKDLGFVKDFVGKRNADLFVSQYEWKNKLEQNKFTPEQLSDMMYYRQRTGSPLKEGDTFNALRDRLPKEAREFVDTTIDKHLKESLKAHNENPILKKINPREGLQDIYLPGLYEYDPVRFDHAYEEVSRQFKAKNPFAEKKSFLSYLEAFEKAGLKPRYNNIVDVMKAYDKVMIKTTANAEFLSKIKEMQKEVGIPFVVTDADPKAFEKAQKNKYVPFWNPVLREGSGKPALLHPDFADAVEGIFNREVAKPDYPFMQKFDKASDALRNLRVSYSPFHYVALGTHAIPAIPKQFLSGGFAAEGRSLRKNKAFMTDALSSGLTVHGSTENIDVGHSHIEKALDYLPEKMANADISKGIKAFASGENYLFKEFQPNLKVVTFDSEVRKEISKRSKDGNIPTKEEVREIKEAIASQINDMYGGQNWETMPVFNDPNTMKWMRRVIGYPDWTVSSIKNVLNIAAPGVKGDLTRKFWMKYGIMYGTSMAALRWINSGWTNDEKGKLTFDFDKAKAGLLDSDPATWYKFPLIDAQIPLPGGNSFNPGRDSEGHKLYGHVAKQVLEVYKEIMTPLAELFVKSNPLIQVAWRQILEQTPGEEKTWAVRGKYDKGEMKPWDATESWTLGRAVSRATDLAQSTLPFNVAGLVEKDSFAPKRLVSSLGGSFPISQGLTPHKAIPALEKAFRGGRSDDIQKIRERLRTNGYTEKQIKKVLVTARKNA